MPATESVYLSNSDFVIRERCRAREDAIIHEKFRADRIEALTIENSALSGEITRLRKLLEEHVIKVE